MLRPFQKYPEEEAVVGRILLSWSEIEFDLAALLGDVLQDGNAAVRTLYRLRGPDMRLQVADALLRPAFSEIALLTEYQNAFAALNFSKRLRNQYAHSHWIDGNGLFFFDLESGAKTRGGDVIVTYRPINAQLLRKQEEYLHYTSRWLWFLQNAYRNKAGVSPSQTVPAPTIVPQPPLDNRQAQSSRQSPTEGSEEPPEEPPAE